MNRWLRRALPSITLISILAALFVLLIALRQDPAFPVLSPLLAILLGGASTSLLQIFTRVTERVNSQEDARRAERKRLNQVRLDLVREMFDQTAYHFNSFDAHINTALERKSRDKSMDIGQELFTKWLETMTTYDRRLQLQGRATANSLGSPTVNTALKDLTLFATEHNSYVSHFDVNNTTPAEFTLWMMSNEQRLHTILGTVYIELDRIALDQFQEP